MKSQFLTGSYCEQYQHAPLMSYCNTSQTAELMEMMEGDKDVGEVFADGSAGDGSKQPKKGVPKPRYLKGIFVKI